MSPRKTSFTAQQQSEDSEIERDLPEGWANVQLNQLTYPTRPRRNPQVFEKLPYVGMEQIESHTRRLLGTSDAADMRSTAFHFQKNDVLYGRLRPYLNKVWLAQFEGLCSSEFIVLPPSGGFDPMYLACFLNTDEFVEFANHLNQGDRPRVSFDQIGEFRIPLPPLAEQRRIVTRLEEVLGKVQQSQQRLARIPVLLKRFRQSVLAAACSGKLTADWRGKNGDVQQASALLSLIASQLGRPLAVNVGETQLLDVPATWEWILAEDLCRRLQTITYGILKPVWVTKGVPTVRVQDMKAGIIQVDSVGQCDPDRAAKFSKTSLESGDLLIAKDGATLGKTAFVPSSLAGGNVTQHVLRFPITQSVVPVFVRIVIDSQHGQEWMRTETKGVALPGVNVSDFRRMPIPLPPLPEQHEIVRRVEQLFAFADQIEARFKKAKAQVDRMTQSLLAKAFRGELVPTEAELARRENRSYEPASELLARIQSERVTQVTAYPSLKIPKSQIQTLPRTTPDANS